MARLAAIGIFPLLPKDPKCLLRQFLGPRSRVAFEFHLGNCSRFGARVDMGLFPRSGADCLALVGLASFPGSKVLCTYKHFWQFAGSKC